MDNKAAAAKISELARKFSARTTGSKIVALASSTGGPKALQSVVPRLPADLDAPMLIVQHMPKGFTASFAERLNDLSSVTVKEAAEGDELQPGTVYIAMGGMHMNVVTHPSGKYTIHYSDEPSREGVKPCANYMFESLADSRFDKIVCVVMTGMGADGTAGIKTLKACSCDHSESGYLHGVRHAKERRERWAVRSGSAAERDCTGNNFERRCKKLASNLPHAAEWRILWM